MQNDTTLRGNQSAAKVLNIMEVMAEHGGAMRLQEISQKSGLPASTILRFLKTLQQNKYVSQDKDSSKYSLTLKVCHLGSLVSSQFSIREIVRPYLENLTEKCQESTCLAIEQDMEVVYLDVVNGPDKMLRTMQRIGKKAPLHSTGVGKLLLTNYNLQDLDKIFETKGLTALTANTITKKEYLLEELNKVRIQGYAVDDEECELGARCIAAPLWDYTDKIVASISASGPISRLTKSRMIEIKDHLIKTAREVSEVLGYNNC